MNKNNVYVLIHSPLVGGLTWALVADQIRQSGLNVVVPLLLDSPDSTEPFWKQHAESVSQALAKRITLLHWWLTAARDLCCPSYDNPYQILSMLMCLSMQVFLAMELPGWT